MAAAAATAVSGFNSMSMKEQISISFTGIFILYFTLTGRATAVIQPDTVAQATREGAQWYINWWYYPVGLLLLALALVFSLRRRHLRKKEEQDKDI